MLSLSIAGAKIDDFFDTCNSYLKKIFFFPHFFSWKDGDYRFCVNFANI